MNDLFVLTIMDTKIVDTKQTSVKYLISVQYKWWTATLYDILEKTGASYIIDRYPERHGHIQRTNEEIKECVWRVEHWMSPMDESRSTDGLFCGTIYT